MVKNQIAGHTDIEIRPLITPTNEQILNCLDGYNVAALSCQKIVLKADESMDVQFGDILDNRMYAVFYAVATEYPLRPVVYGEVKKVEMNTVVLFDKNTLSYLAMTLLVIISMMF
jgi:hypothetical protein